VTSHDEPNPWGFAGDPAMPQPARDTPEEREEDQAERVAIPSDDLTEDITEALAEVTDHDEEGGPADRGPRGQ
jgi:hypothetical protein